MGLHLFAKQQKTQRRKGQAMVEFALVFPIFLLLVMGVIELGHLIFIYSSVYVSSREAARYGAAAGYTSSGTPYYQDCAGMRDAAQRVGAYGGVTNATLAPAAVDTTHNTGVAIELWKDGATSPVDYSTCPDLDVVMGDRIRVTTQVYYEPIVPLVPIPAFAISHTSTRTILKNVDLEKVDPGAPPVADTYGVELSIDDNTLMGVAGTQVVYNVRVKNTGSIFDTYVLTLSGNNWTTTIQTPVSVAPNATIERQVTVSVPPAAPHGATDSVVVTATSIGDPGVPPASDSLVLTTSAPVYGVTLTTDDDAKGGPGGTTVTYNVIVNNTGNIDDTYTLSASGNSWPVTFPTSIAVSAGSSNTFQISVAIPADVGSNTNDAVTIRAVSDGDPITPPVSASHMFTTSAPSYGVLLTISDNTLSGKPGKAVDYYVRITNTGNIDDSYDLILSGNGWATTVTSPVFVAAGASEYRKVTVTIPVDVTHGATDTVTITAISLGDPGDPKTSDDLALTTTALAYGVSLSVAPSSYQMGVAGGTVTFSLTVTNTGTIDDSYTLTLSGNAWTTTLDGSVSVAVGTPVTLPVVVTIPATATNGASDRVTITATSQGDPLTPKASASISLRTAVPRYGVYMWLTVPDDSLSGAPGDKIQYVLSIRNTGNVTDTFTLSLSGNAWATVLSTTSVTLNAGASRTDILVTVTIDADALHNATDVVTVTAYSGDVAAPRASTSLALSTTATRVCPYAGSLGLGNKSINLLLYNNSLYAEDVRIEQVIVNWYKNTETQYLDYISYLGRNIMDGNVNGSLTNPFITSIFPADGAWMGDATFRDLPAGASNYGFNIYFIENLDTTTAHSIEIRFDNGCYISR